MTRQRPASNVEWQKWGQVDPLFGVSAKRGKEKGGSSPWTDAEFYSLGKRTWEQVVAHWQKYGLDTEICLEIGCGAGRMTGCLAETFRTLHALDPSEGMIAYAREHVSASNVVFHVTDGLRIPLPDRSVTAVFSTHVFQHFDHVDQAASYFAEVARVLKPGGTLMIHLPIHRWPVMPVVFEMIYRSRKFLGGFVAGVRRRLLRLGLGRPFMRWLSYSVEYLLRILPSVGLTDVEVWIFSPLRDNRDSHPFVLARRREATAEA